MVWPHCYVSWNCPLNRAPVLEECLSPPRDPFLVTYELRILDEVFLFRVQIILQPFLSLRRVVLGTLVGAICHRFDCV